MSSGLGLKPAPTDLSIRIPALRDRPENGDWMLSFAVEAAAEQSSAQPAGLRSMHEC